MSNLSNPRNYLPDDGGPKLTKLRLTVVVVPASEVAGAGQGAGAAILSRYDDVVERNVYADNELMAKAWRAPITLFEPGLTVEDVERKAIRVGLMMVAPEQPSVGRPERRALTIVCSSALIEAAIAAIKSPEADGRWTEIAGALKRCETVEWVPAITKVPTPNAPPSLDDADIWRAHALALQAIKTATTRLRGGSH